jgi:hypothetical protein
MPGQGVSIPAVGFNSSSTGFRTAFTQKPCSLPGAVAPGIPALRPGLMVRSITPPRNLLSYGFHQQRKPGLLVNGEKPQIGTKTNFKF